MKGDKEISIGDLVKKTTGPAKGKLAIVVDVGHRDTDALLSNWVRIRYVEDAGYEWIQKSAVELAIKS